MFPLWRFSAIARPQAGAQRFICRGLPSSPLIMFQKIFLKTMFLLAISSLKRVDLQALSVSPTYLEFAQGMVKVFLYPKPGYVSKVPTIVHCIVLLSEIRSMAAFISGVFLKDVCDVVRWSHWMCFYTSLVVTSPARDGLCRHWTSRHTYFRCNHAE